MQNSKTAEGTGPRWWPLVLILLLAIASSIFIWIQGNRIGQERVMLTAAVCTLTVIAALIWLLFLSRFSWRRRIIVLAVVLLAVLGFSSLFRFKGVSGDLVPVVEWRWSGPGELLSTGLGLFADSDVSDYPQFLGPNGDAVLPPISFARDWELKPPKLIWSRPMGEGWSAFAVQGKLAVTQDQVGESERIAAYELATGKEVWEYSYSARYETALAGVGPRSTPTIKGGRVYAAGATGILNCLDVNTGSLIWSRDFVEESGGSIPVWGYSGSPLVFDNLVVVSSCGTDGKSLTAYDKDNGRLVWQGGDDSCGYSTPQIRSISGVRQIITFNQSSLASHSPTDGTVLWQHDWSKTQPNVSQPLVLPGNQLFASSGYGVGCKLFQVEADGHDSLSVRLMWETPRLKAKFTNVVFHRGFLYGLDDGTMVCLDPENGQRRWKKGRYGHGQVILVGDLLLVLSEKGEVALVEPNPTELRELTRFQALEGKTWNPPALAGRYLLVRNHRQAVCYEVPAP